MLDNSLYVGVPIGAFFCFLFLLLCFFHAPWSRAVRYFRQTILVCLLWTGAAVFMRLQIWPGISFWYNLSLFGILLLPLAIYQFVFHMMGIQKRFFLAGTGSVTVLLVFWNALTGSLLLPPEAVTEADGGVGYVYSGSSEIGILICLEIAAFAYVLHIVHTYMKKDPELKEKLTPILIGALFILLGNILELLPGNEFPYDTLGGVFMSFCLVYVMYRQFLFDLGNRLAIGAIYTLTVGIASLPVWFVGINLDSFVTLADKENKQFFFFGIFLLCIWAGAISLLGHGLAEKLVERKHRRITLKTQQFQSLTASLFSREALFEQIAETVQELVRGSSVWIFQKEEGAEDGYALVYAARDRYQMPQENRREIIKAFENGNRRDRQMICLEYDDKPWGFIYMELLVGGTVNYWELMAVKQVGISASICLKNISIYKSAYENSIHDELTGLYNRTYSREFLEKNWKAGTYKSIILLDVDNFKLFNELYGEETGDSILKWCAGIIRETVEKGEDVFRSGSNEFLITSKAEGKEKLICLANKIQRSMEEGKEKPRVLQPITFSIGIALTSSQTRSSDELLKQAEKAVFFAKRNGRNRIEVFESGFDTTEDMEYRGYEQIAPTIYALMAAIDAKDSFTFEHSGHVSEYAVLLAQRLGMQKNDIQIIKEAGLLHDIGKISIPEHILKKKGKLLPEEYEIMKTHVASSIEIIHFLPNMSYVIPAVVSHHERYDGKGYPRGIAGEDIPLMGRILAVCDSFDAMISKRSYKEAMTIDYAVMELERNKGTQFDPDIADTFIGLVRDGIISV